PGPVRCDPAFEPGARRRPATRAHVKERRASVSATDAERIVDHVRDPQGLGLVGHRLVEAAELPEAIEHRDAFVRYGRRVSESLVDRGGWKRREVVEGQGDRPSVVAPDVVCLCEIAHGQEPELQAPERSAISSAREPAMSAASSSPTIRWMTFMNA